MIICKTKGCAQAADWVAFWPGQTTLMCQACLQRARGIARAMGFELVARGVVEWMRELDKARRVADAAERLGATIDKLG